MKAAVLAPVIAIQGLISVFGLLKTAMIAVRQYLEDNPGSFDLVEWVLFEDFTYAAYENAAKSPLAVR